MISYLKLREKLRIASSNQEKANLIDDYMNSFYQLMGDIDDDQIIPITKRKIEENFELMLLRDKLEDSIYNNEYRTVFLIRGKKDEILLNKFVLNLIKYKLIDRKDKNQLIELLQQTQRPLIKHRIEFKGTNKLFVYLFENVLRSVEWYSLSEIFNKGTVSSLTQSAYKVRSQTEKLSEKENLIATNIINCCK